MPPLARQARIEGIVRMKILVDKTGVVKCIAAVFGHPLLTNILPAAVTQWRFQPYNVNGKPIAVLGLLDFHFSTSDQRFVSLEYDYHPPQGR